MFKFAVVALFFLNFSFPANAFDSPLAAVDGFHAISEDSLLKAARSRYESANTPELQTEIKARLRVLYSQCLTEDLLADFRESINQNFFNCGDVYPFAYPSGIPVKERLEIYDDKFSKAVVIIIYENLQTAVFNLACKKSGWKIYRATGEFIDFGN